MFRILDDSKNRKIEPAELENGLRDFGVNLNDVQISVLAKHFDRDGSGSIDFDEFLRTIRGDLNDYRLSFIKAAYEKLDVNKDGQVKLDDIAKLYDVSEHPDVQAGKDSQAVYTNFMA